MADDLQTDDAGKTAVTVSIVSHGHHRKLTPLLHDLARCPEVAQLILTRNIPEPLPSIPEGLRARTQVIDNLRTRSFAANHNTAFSLSQSPYFAILNPDLRLPENPFPALLHCIRMRPGLLVSPGVLNPTGAVEDHARRFPTPWQLLNKLLRLVRGKKTDIGGYHYVVGNEPFFANWVAGIFMLCPRETFRALGGFDERYPLYYEDVDLCVRAWRAGFAVAVSPQVAVVHEGQRASRGDLRYLKWHLKSVVRYLLCTGWRLPIVAEAEQPVTSFDATQKP